MSLLGSQDDDPLLQGDPLAPASDEETAGQGTPSADEESNAENAEPEEDRMLVYSRDEAREGTFPQLNRCLQEDWRLTRIQFQEDGALAFHLRRDPNINII